MMHPSRSENAWRYLCWTRSRSSGRSERRSFRRWPTVISRPLRACLQHDVSFRALVPPGIRRASDASGTVNRIRLWFGEADSFEMLRSEIGRISDRLSITYRIRLHDSDGWQVIEQRLYCNVGDNGR